MATLIEPTPPTPAELVHRSEIHHEVEMMVRDARVFLDAVRRRNHRLAWACLGRVNEARRVCAERTAALERIAEERNGAA